MNRWINCFRILSRETSAAREFPRALTMKPNRLFILAKKTRTTHDFAHAFLLAVAFSLCFGQANQADVHITSRISHAPRWTESIHDTITPKLSKRMRI
jgi:hypothetical protein